MNLPSPCRSLLRPAGLNSPESVRRSQEGCVAVSEEKSRSVPEFWDNFPEAIVIHGNAKGVAGTVSLLFRFLPFFFRFFSVFSLFSFRFLPFFSVLFRFFRFIFRQKQGDIVRETPFAKPRKPGKCPTPLVLTLGLG